jgi:hypothetical protein
LTPFLYYALVVDALVVDALVVDALVVAAGDYVRSKLRCAPFFAHIHRPYSRRYRGGCKVFDVHIILRTTLPSEITN